MANTIANVPVMQETDGVQIINICTLLDSLFNGQNVGWEKECEGLKSWCSVNNASYYGVPREDFSLYAAAQQAKEEGNTVVVVEDLS